MELEYKIVKLAQHQNHFNLNPEKVKKRLQDLFDYNYDPTFDCESFEKRFGNPPNYKELYKIIKSYESTEKELNRAKFFASCGYNEQRFKETLLPGLKDGIKMLSRIYGNVLAFPANAMLNHFGHLGQFAVYSLEIIGILYLGSELIDHEFLKFFPLLAFSPSFGSITKDGQPTRTPDSLKILSDSWFAMQRRELEKELKEKGQKLSEIYQKYFYDCK